MPQRNVKISQPARNSRTIGIPESPYLTLDEGARFCRFDATADDPRNAFRQWLHRNAVPIRKRGKTILIERRVLENCLLGEG